MRRVLAIITALAVTFTGMTAALAADETDTSALTSMSDAEKAEFINENDRGIRWTSERIRTRSGYGRGGLDK